MGEIPEMVLAAAAFGCLGLWWGERGRRIAAENRALYGTPNASPARSIPAPPDAEERAATFGFSQETLDRGAEQLLKIAKQRGVPLTRAAALQQAETMLHPDASFEAGAL